MSHLHAMAGTSLPCQCSPAQEKSWGDQNAALTSLGLHQRAQHKGDESKRLSIIVRTCQIQSRTYTDNNRKAKLGLDDQRAGAILEPHKDVSLKPPGHIKRQLTKLLFILIDSQMKECLSSNYIQGSRHSRSAVVLSRQQ